MVLPKTADGIGDSGREGVSLELDGETENQCAATLVLRRKADFESRECVENGAHGLGRVGEDDLLVRVALLVVVATMMNEFHLLEDSRLSLQKSVSGFCFICFPERGHNKRTLPDSPAPSKSILISFFA